MYGECMYFFLVVGLLASRGSTYVTSLALPSSYWYHFTSVECTVLCAVYSHWLASSLLSINRASEC